MARRKGSGITSVKFNQDQGCFSCCLTTGLRIYNTEPLVEKSHYGVDEIGEVLLCEMVQRSNWLLVVRARQPKTLALLDDRKRRIAADVTFQSKIWALIARIDKIAVLTTSAVHILALPSLRRVAMMLRGSSVGDASCCVALAAGPAPYSQLVVAPAHRRGAVQMLDVSTVSTESGCLSRTPVVLSCHRANIAALTLSHDATRLCTASQRGTILRVWDTRSKKLMYQLRRGADQALLYCINFSLDGNNVCCVSDKGTAHVWKGSEHVGRARLPNNANAASQAVCSVKDNTLYVISVDGSFYKYTFTKEGNCHQELFEYYLQVGDDDDFID